MAVRRRRRAPPFGAIFGSVGVGGEDPVFPGRPFVLADVATIEQADATPLLVWENNGADDDFVAFAPLQAPTFFSSGGPEAGDGRVFFSNVGAGSKIQALNPGPFHPQPGVTAVVWRAASNPQTNSSVLFGSDQSTAGWQTQLRKNGPNLATRVNAGMAVQSGNGVLLNTWYISICEVNGLTSTIETFNATFNTTGAGDAGAELFKSSRLGSSPASTQRYDGDIAWCSGSNDGTTKAQVLMYLAMRFPSLFP